jgi:hypothetical protein
MGQDFPAADGPAVVALNGRRERMTEGGSCMSVTIAIKFLTLLVSMSALANGMGVQTYCKGKSKTPTGRSL